MSQLLPWAIGRRSGNDVVRITNAIVPGCLLPVCFPLCSYTLTMLHHRYPTGASSYTAVRFRVSSICGSWSRIRSIICEILCKTIGDANLRAPTIKNIRYSAPLASVTSSRSNSLSVCLSNLSIFPSISPLLSVNTYPAANPRGKQRQFLPHIDTYTYTKTLSRIASREKSPFKVVLHPLDRPMPAVDPSG